MVVDSALRARDELAMFFAGNIPRIKDSTIAYGGMGEGVVVHPLNGIAE